MLFGVRALVKTHAGPGLEMVDVPEPQPGPTDVKIRVLRAGLCGTDLHLEQWDDWAASTVKAPMTIGHEFYGEVVEVGEDVDSVRVGQRASGEGHIVCGTCRNCRAGRRHMCIHTKGIGVNRDGAFADFVVIPASNVWVQPDDLDPDLGAVFDPLGNATHTALSFPMAGEDVVITGRRPDRGDGRRPRAARRRPARGGHRPERLPARAGQGRRRRPGRQRPHLGPG